ncbi:MAG: PTS system mannose/fructose/sorbose family transporter subunit IID [Gemmatimonadota bacterium]|jgi:mannose/fructose/N-acetylgalactosamine-specific phosphotransferase system component IID
MDSVVTGLPPAVAARVLARSFLVQAAWNYHTLQGTGMAFALLPALEHIHRTPEALQAALSRHAAPFNAHPYLDALALGSLCRLEADGEPDVRIRRFRAAVGGPLGALGDRLVWAAWLPLCTAIAVCLYLAGASPFWTVLTFLVLYNVGHVGLRIWGFREGWASGVKVAVRLRSAGLARMSSRLEGWLAAALGFLVGLAIGAPAVRGTLPLLWAAAAVSVLVAGAALGPRVWRPTAVATVAAVASILTVGFFV